MKKQVITLFVLVLTTVVLTLQFSFGSTGPDAAPKGITSITAREIKAHINLLASGMYEGRGNGERGLELAAEYIAAQFEDAGLEPIGDDSSYFQAFDLISKKLAKPNMLEVTSKHGSATVIFDYRIGEDFIPFNFTVSKKVVAPIAFVGYGITAPEHKYDDYKSVDVNGKIVLVLRHEPQEKDTSSVFNGNRFTKYATFDEKARNAQKHGAVGMILVTDPNNHDSYAVQPVDRAWPENPPARRKPMALPDPENSVDIPAVHVTMAVAQDLMGGTGKSLSSIQKNIDATLKPNSFVLKNKKVTLQTKVRKEIITLRNVVGMVKGTGDEVVVVGAHYDHDGLGSDGEIFYGADDDASGTVGLLELSEAFMLNEQKPARSIIFVAFAAEEKGLFGSKYYANNPLIPLNQTVAMVQMDMIGRNEDTESMPKNRRRGLPVISVEESENSLHVIGTTYSDIKKFSERANEKIGMELDYTYDTLQNLVRRSDQWPFLQKEVPAIFFFTGFHPDYHTPADTPDKINYEKMVKVLKLIYLTTWDLANNPDLPKYQAPEDLK